MSDNLNVSIKHRYKLDKPPFDVNKYKEKQLSTILASGLVGYDKYDLANTSARELPKHILDHLYGKCLQENLYAYMKYIESQQEHTDYGSDFYGWHVCAVIEDNEIEVRAYNVSITLTIKPKMVDDVHAFMEVLSSLEYEVR